MSFMASTKSIKRMSDTVIFCELRAAWGEVESQIRAGLQPQPTVSAYVVALTAEQTRRAGK